MWPIKKSAWLVAFLSMAVVQAIFGVWYANSDFFTERLGLFLIAVPIATGLVNFWITHVAFKMAGLDVRLHTRSILFLPLVSAFLILGSSLALVTPLACFVVIAAPSLFFTTMGLFLGFILQSAFMAWKGKIRELGLISLIPMTAAYWESTLDVQNRFETVTTQIEIEAPRESVWNNITSVETIQDHELETHFIHVIGIPKPRRATLTLSGVGGVRKIAWDEGVEFEERITNWRPLSGFQYEIDKKHQIPADKIDKHVQIGGAYFDVLSGSYEIAEPSPGRILVTLKVDYRVTTTMNWYSKWWADFFLNDLQESILEVIKKRAERA